MKLIAFIVEEVLSITININMRCIEMLDILLAMNVIRQININMRCIEIYITSASDFSFIRININMRCIEITKLLV